MKSIEYLKKYNISPKVWDEMFDNDSSVRQPYQKIISYLSNESIDDLNKKEELAKRLFMSQ
jgi:uncharacterized circularly permuted ATP-grasp superfamily protein